MKVTQTVNAMSRPKMINPMIMTDRSLRASLSLWVSMTVSHIRLSVCNLRLVFISVKPYVFMMRNMANFFSALADPTRLRLLYLMKNGEICVCFFQSVLQTNQPKVSRHLAYLKRAGLVEARRDGKWMHYRLKALESDFQKILADSLRHLEREPQIKKDSRRLSQITCSPERYGISAFKTKRQGCQ